MPSTTYQYGTLTRIDKRIRKTFPILIYNHTLSRTLSFHFSSKNLCLLLLLCKLECMIEIDDRLSEKFHQQMDGIYAQDEEQRLCLIAQSYSICENSIAVLSNLRIGKSHIFFGKSCSILGLGKPNTIQTVDSVWEEEIYNRIHPDDWKKRCLQELTFFRKISSSHSKESFSWYLENTMRMCGKDGKFHYWKHRIFYFSGNGQQGISYSLCLYNLTSEDSEAAYLINTMTGERKILLTDENQLLSAREKIILQMIQTGTSSKTIAEQLKISKHTVDRHRQNIITKLRVNNTIEACHKAKRLGMID